jgi:hypothetical protein
MATMEPSRILVEGRWEVARSAATRQTWNPATGEVVGVWVLERKGFWFPYRDRVLP